MSKNRKRNLKKLARNIITSVGLMGGALGGASAQETTPPGGGSSVAMPLIGGGIVGGSAIAAAVIGSKIMNKNSQAVLDLQAKQFDFAKKIHEEEKAVQDRLQAPQLLDLDLQNSVNLDLEKGKMLVNVLKTGRTFSGSKEKMDWKKFLKWVSEVQDENVQKVIWGVTEKGRASIAPGINTGAGVVQLTDSGRYNLWVRALADNLNTQAGDNCVERAVSAITKLPAESGNLEKMVRLGFLPNPPSGQGPCWPEIVDGAYKWNDYNGGTITSGFFTWVDGKVKESKNLAREVGNELLPRSVLKDLKDSIRVNVALAMIDPATGALEHQQIVPGQNAQWYEKLKDPEMQRRLKKGEFFAVLTIEAPNVQGLPSFYPVALRTGDTKNETGRENCEKMLKKLGAWIARCAKGDDQEPEEVFD